MDYGSLVRTIRERLALTQEQFAGLVGVTRNSVARWESGLRSPKAEQKKIIVKLAEEHNVEIKYFLYIRNKK